MQGGFLTVVLWFAVISIALAVVGLLSEIWADVQTIRESP